LICVSEKQTSPVLNALQYLDLEEATQMQLAWGTAKQEKRLFAK